MAKSSLMKKIARVLGEEEDVSNEDLDRELADAVSTIRKAGVEVMDNEEAIGEDWGASGDRIHVLNMDPIYESMGSNSPRVKAGAKTICEHAFEREIGLDEGTYHFAGEHFVMELTGLKEDEAFRKATLIVNAIGTQLLGAKFKNLQVPGLMIVADAEDITNQDGTLNMKALSAEVKKGGKPIPMKEPDPNDPVWLRLRWKTKLSGRPELMKAKKAAPKAEAGTEPQADPRQNGLTAKEWEVLKREGKKHAAATAKTPRDQSQWKKRSGKDRRGVVKQINWEDRRQSFDRRGRGH